MVDMFKTPTIVTSMIILKIKNVPGKIIKHLKNNSHSKSSRHNQPSVDL
jgi:hypothetical protein